VVAIVAPVSLLALYLWSTTPSLPSPHDLDAGGGATLARLAVFLAAWMLMTVAMMLPSAMPLIASLDRIARHQPNRQGVPLFAALAYLCVWGLVGIAVWATSVAVGAFILPQTSEQVMTRLVGGCLVLIGLYGLSPLADACLRACRRPFGFLARYWSGGSGALLQAARIGAAYGIACVGCCIPMLGIMFFGGMANIAIVITMGVLLVIMKSNVVGALIARFLSIALICVGTVMAIAWVPLFPTYHH
jgi:predicted metal-binding membrane protein